MTTRFVHEACGAPLFEAAYVRNNKSSGRKHVRCFPHCCGGHRPNRFCGASLMAEYGGSKRCSWSIGRFELAETCSFVVGESIVDPTALGIRSSRDPQGDWNLGQRLSTDDSQTFCFNPTKMAWHYGMCVDRTRREQQHVFRVYFFDAMDRCLEILTSPSFTIKSSRRAKKRTTSLPPTSCLKKAKQDSLELDLLIAEPLLEAPEPDVVNLFPLVENDRKEVMRHLYLIRQLVLHVPEPGAIDWLTTATTPEMNVVLMVGSKLIQHCFDPKVWTQVQKGAEVGLGLSALVESEIEQVLERYGFTLSTFATAITMFHPQGPTWAQEDASDVLAFNPKTPETIPSPLVANPRWNGRWERNEAKSSWTQTECPYFLSHGLFHVGRQWEFERGIDLVGQDTFRFRWTKALTPEWND